jgi:hypothetical protein
MSKDPHDKLVNRADEELKQLVEYLCAAIIEMDALDAILLPEHKDAAERVKENLGNLNVSASFLIAMLLEMGDTIRVLLRQRQSAKYSFMAGWRGYHRDLLSHLTEEQRREIQSIMDKVFAQETLS